MRYILFHCVSGDSLYTGQALLLAVLALSSRARSRFTRLSRDALAVGGALLTVLATPPLPFVWYAAFLFSLLAWLVVSNGPALLPPFGRYAAAVATAVLGLSAVVMELPRAFFHRPAAWYHSLTVVGDSVSAGLSGPEEAWPAAYSRAFHVPVDNRARVAAKAGDILPSLGDARFDRQLVLVEIGGNDELFGTPPAVLERDLRALLGRLQTRSNAIVMFELPLLPMRQEFGRIQRQLADEFHVALIPKRYFAAVLAAPDATSDGLHLTPVGIARMVDTVHQLLGSVLVPSSSSTTDLPHW